VLSRALAGDPPIVRADARLRRAEALARIGRADEAQASCAPRRWSRSGPPTARGAGRADGVRAGARRRARGDAELARDALREAERHWRRLAGEELFASEHLVSLVDLGRPP
jgi:hypothetical protein